MRGPDFPSPSVQTDLTEISQFFALLFLLNEQTLSCFIFDLRDFTLVVTACGFDIGWGHGPVVKVPYYNITITGKQVYCNKIL